MPTPVRMSSDRGTIPSGDVTWQGGPSGNYFGSPSPYATFVDPQCTNERSLGSGCQWFHPEPSYGYHKLHTDGVGRNCSGGYGRLDCRSRRPLRFCPFSRIHCRDTRATCEQHHACAVALDTGCKHEQEIPAHGIQVDPNPSRYDQRHEPSDARRSYRLGQYE